MKEFIDFILADKVYMIIAAIIIILVVLLVVLIIRLIIENGKVKKANTQASKSANTVYSPNMQYEPQQSQSQTKYSPQQQNRGDIQRNNYNNSISQEGSFKTEAIENPNTSNNLNKVSKQSYAPAMKDIPVLKQNNMDIQGRGKAVYETEALYVEPQKPSIGETQLLSQLPTKLGSITYQDGNETKVYEIYSEITNIGRDPEVCDLVINNDAHLGRKHALIYFKNGKCYLTDLNSKNGTYINGERLQGEKQIEEVTDIKLATTELKLKVF